MSLLAYILYCIISYIVSLYINMHLNQIYISYLKWSFLKSHTFAFTLLPPPLFPSPSSVVLNGTSNFLYSIWKYKDSFLEISIPLIISKFELQKLLLEIYISFLKFIFKIWNWVMANSILGTCNPYLNYIDEFSINIFPTLKDKNHIWKNLFLIIKYLFPRNSYVYPIWIFIFDTDQAQIYSEW